MAVLSLAPLQSSVLATPRLHACIATGVSCNEISAGRPLVRCGSTAVVAGLLTAIVRKIRLPQLHQRSWTSQQVGGRRLRTTAQAVATTPPDAGGENYVPILVERADGSKLQVEVRPSDEVKVLKAMIALKTGVSEAFQELAASGVKMEDFCLMSEYNIDEGAVYTLTELQEDEQEVVLRSESVEGEVLTRVYVTCDAGFGKKQKKVAMDVSGTETIKDIKVKAYNEIAASVEPLRRKQPKYFGLFIPQSPVQTEKGNLRYLSRREERLPETNTVEEAGLKGDEEILLVDLFWTKL